MLTLVWCVCPALALLVASLFLFPLPVVSCVAGGSSWLDGATSPLLVSSVDGSVVAALVLHQVSIDVVRLASLYHRCRMSCGLRLKEGTASGEATPLQQKSPKNKGHAPSAGMWLVIAS